MRKIYVIKRALLFFALLTTTLFAQNHDPVVENVSFTQRTDGSYKVDISYDLHDADSDAMTVSMQVSDDGGATWDFTATDLSGHIGIENSISSGTGKQIVWDYGAEHPGTLSSQIQIKVIADDNGGGLETGTMTDIDGNVYKTVKIGDQWWMAENLKVTHYRNGEAIPNITSNSQWVNLSTGAYASYDNDNANIATYGLLYNWYAVDDSRTIAPAGWHVPTDKEWKELEMALGMSQSEADDTGWRGIDEGTKLKATSGWYNNGNGTNISGFSALPGGYRSGSSGAFYVKGTVGYWWSSWPTVVTMPGTAYCITVFQASAASTSISLAALAFVVLGIDYPPLFDK